MITDRIFAACIMTLALAFATAAADAAELFALKSTTFADGKIMPKKVANSTANMPNNSNCVGENVSPQLSWTNVPDGTKSFVFLMIDLEGRGGAGVNHWVAYGIPASVTGFGEGEVSKQTDKYAGGKSTQGVAFYSGPCTPQSNSPSLYVRADRNRSGANRISARIDERGSDGEAGSSWATADPHQRSRRHGRTLHQSMARVTSARVTSARVTSARVTSARVTSARVTSAQVTRRE